MLSHPHHVSIPMQIKYHNVPDWSVYNSVFAQRKKENESRDVYDTDKVWTEYIVANWCTMVFGLSKTYLYGRIWNPESSEIVWSKTCRHLLFNH